MSSDERRDGPVLKASEVTVTLGGVSIVESVDLALTTGDLVLLVGPNGAGKSTLLRALVGLLPSRGDIELGGRYPASLQARGSYVFTPDEPALYEDLTLTEHARFNALIYRRPEAEERTLEWLSAFGLDGKLEEFPSTHSRGMRQKLALALALGLQMPLTLLDEPFNGLDLESQELLADGLMRTAANGGAVLLTGHQRELGSLLEAKVIELRDGQLAPAGKVGRGAPKRVGVDSSSRS